MTTIPELITAMVPIAAAIDGLAAAKYPAPATISVSPTLVFYWGGEGEVTTINHRTTEQEWETTITGRILVTHQDNTPAEIARIDALITPLMDTFGIDTDGNSALEREAGLMALRGIYRLLPERARPSLTVDYAGQKCYAGDVIFGVRLDRIPGGN